MKQNLKTEYRINYSISAKEVRVSTNGESKILNTKKAIELAESMDKDLIEINARTNPPIAVIEDYSKFLYALKKKAKSHKMHKCDLKEIQLTVSIAENDLKTKARQASEFLNKGNKVKVVLTMKGRELARRDENKKSLYLFISMLEDCSIPEFIPKDEGNKTIVILKKK